jgi:hypothetical protein
MNCSGRTTKFYQEPSELMDTLDQVDLTDTYKIFHPSTAQYIPFISPWNILQTPNIRNLKELPVLGQIIWNKTRIQQKRKL